MLGYCASLCDEFRDFSKRTSLHLSRRELEEFATSPFFSSARAFYFYRLGAATYMGIIVLASFVTALLDIDGTLELYLIYYTRWSLLVVEAYLVCACLATRRHARFLGELAPLHICSSSAASTPSEPRVGSDSYAALAAFFTSAEAPALVTSTAPQLIPNSPSAPTDIIPRRASRPLFWSPDSSPISEGQGLLLSTHDPSLSVVQQRLSYQSFENEVIHVSADGVQMKSTSQFHEVVSEDASGLGASSETISMQSRTPRSEIQSINESKPDITDEWLSMDDMTVDVRPDRLIRTTWILQNIIFPNTLLVAIVFWFIIYPGISFNGSAGGTDDLSSGSANEGSSSIDSVVEHNILDQSSSDNAGIATGSGASNEAAELSTQSGTAAPGDHYSPVRYFMCTQEHGANFALMAIDVFLSRAPYRIAQVHHAASYGSTYLAFSLLYYGAYGRNDEGRRYIYPQLNWATPMSTSILVVAFFALFLPLVMWATWTIWYLGRVFGKWLDARREDRREAQAQIIHEGTIPLKE